jgi:RHS repeat-associated protein
MLPSQKNGYQAVMRYSYDSFGRMLEMTFPGASAEVVRYGYDAGGKITSARGLDTVVTNPNKTPDTIYLRHLGYDELDARTRMVAGNGVETRYAYEADTRRLAQVNSDFRDPFQVAHGGGQLPMQRLRYAYDLMANVRIVQNAVPVDGRNGAVRVSPTSFAYDYDRQYQLTHVDGLDQDQNNARSRYSLDYGYDEIGNITRKNQQDFRDQVGPNGVFQAGNALPGTSYRLDYTYAGRGPHAVSHLDETAPNGQLDGRDIGRDGDGNQSGWTFRNGQQRVQTWTEDDRLRSVQDQGHVAGQYLYNAGGARTHNLADGRELVYVNQFVTLRGNGPSFTKHVYAGDTRIASKVDGDSAPKAATFWYHGDQLQSTQFVTDGDQSLVEHHEYFASGEVWRDEGGSQLETAGPDFLFSGKELDASTGYYYFGARYYDPKVQAWQSTDPILASYLRGGPAGGVFHPRNLGLYAYAWNSPAVVRDPDGRVVKRDDSLAPVEKGVLRELQKGTDDKISFDKNGTLRIDKMADNPKHQAGTQLLRRLIASDHTVTLTKDTAGTGLETVPKKLSAAFAKQGGTDSTIKLDLNDTGTPKLVAGPKGKNVIENGRPFFIGLYHELIHADHMTRGDHPWGTTEFEFMNEHGDSTTLRIPKAEMQTVGLGFNVEGDITENQIRTEQGLPERRAYNYPNPGP